MWAVWLLAVCIGGGNVVKNIFNSGLAVRTGSAILGTLSSFTGAATYMHLLDKNGVNVHTNTRHTTIHTKPTHHTTPGHQGLDVPRHPRL